MTEINSKLLLASRNIATGDILMTFVWTYPRMVLAEVNTHRMFSRNTSSSRAIPSKKQRGKVLHDPFVPTHIGSAKKGMQAGEEITGWRRWAIEKLWAWSRYPALAAAYGIEKLGAHKQIGNRLLEPWVWTQQLVSATTFDNFFLLRDHHMAEPHFQELAAQAHKQAIVARESLEMYGRQKFFKTNVATGTRIQNLHPGEWHLPFIDPFEECLQDSSPDGMETIKKISAARCARVSYLLPETGLRSTIDRDLERFNSLAGSVPAHLSPLEHPAVALEESVWCGNYKGFKQFRKEIPNEAGF